MYNYCFVVQASNDITARNILLDTAKGTQIAFYLIDFARYWRTQGTILSLGELRPEADYREK